VGDIGEKQREIEIEPINLPETAPVQEPAWEPPVPAEPVPVPA
jgi:hypothetical protein